MIIYWVGCRGSSSEMPSAFEISECIWWWTIHDMLSSFSSTIPCIYLVLTCLGRFGDTSLSLCFTNFFIHGDVFWLLVAHCFWLNTKTKEPCMTMITMAAMNARGRCSQDCLAFLCLWKGALKYNLGLWDGFIGWQVIKIHISLWIVHFSDLYDHLRPMYSQWWVHHIKATFRNRVFGQKFPKACFPTWNHYHLIVSPGKAEPAV